MSLNSPHHLRQPLPNPEPLTDSGIRRALGTQIRLHLPDGHAVEVGLLDIVGCATWRDVAMHVGRRIVIETTGPLPRVFAGGVVLWAEVVES